MVQLGDGSSEDSGRFGRTGGTAGHQDRQAGAMGSGHTIAGILNGNDTPGRQVELGEGEAIGLGVGLLAPDILAADAQLKSIHLPGQQPLQQGGHGAATAGGDDRLRQTGGGRRRDQPRHAGAQPQLTGGHGAA